MASELKNGGSVRAMPVGPRSRPSDGAAERLHASRVDRYRDPSHSFISLTRNTALESPKRFEPVTKRPGSFEFVNGKLVEVRP